MTGIRYLTDWFIPKISDHQEVTQANRISDRRLLVQRRYSSPFTIAPVSGMENLTPSLVDEILDDAPADVICLVPKASHYLWPARERAKERESDVQTMSEVFWTVTADDPRGFLNKNVAYARRVLRQHSHVQRVEMICEASMKLIRVGRMPNVRLSVEYEYEFGSEALVKALEHHPGVNVVLNSNPNGKPTRAAMRHAENAGVRLLDMSSLMGILNRP
ncbi:hypothetical protein [Streptomyces sp. FH025]|uniref:hypothetical protein n=1 Tax=Streptomyces sp. FH025 TaxID=2815937 RepID=UPI001A9FED05|nr:hypothetical protein [Streptomyces sp. FH025]MBO1418400.1 hypothetical protein [Streptomyces sp. FH025]